MSIRTILLVLCVMSIIIACNDNTSTIQPTNINPCDTNGFRGTFYDVMDTNEVRNILIGKHWVVLCNELVFPAESVGKLFKDVQMIAFQDSNKVLIIRKGGISAQYNWSFYPWYWVAGKRIIMELKFTDSNNVPLNCWDCQFPDGNHDQYQRFVFTDKELRIYCPEPIPDGVDICLMRLVAD